MVEMEKWTERNEESQPAPFWHLISLTILSLYLGGAIPGFAQLATHLHLHLGKSGVRVFSFLIFLNVLLTLYALWGFHLQGKEKELVFSRRRNWKPSARDVLAGIALGIGLMIVSIVIGNIFPGGERNAAPELAKTAIDRIVGFITIGVVSFCEEIQDRGYFLQQFFAITRNTGFAVILQAILFVLGHGLHQGLSGYLTRFVIGVAFGVIAITRDSLWPSAIAHTLINFTAFIAGLF
jgi:membrane protease YdiL (CAAX protease family)